VAGLTDRAHAASREQVPASVRARILALSRTSPPAETGLTHWSSREMAAYVKRTAGVYVSHHYVTKLWRDNGIKPHRQGTFTLSRDPAFAEKVADVVGLYLDPPGGAAERGATVVLAVRDVEKGKQAAARLGAAADVTVQELDLASLESVRAAAADLHATLPKIDLLINNAGVMYPPRQTTRDGFELQFGTNHLGTSRSPACCWTCCCRLRAPGW
jgi:hypothetical protein